MVFCFFFICILFCYFTFYVSFLLHFAQFHCKFLVLSYAFFVHLLLFKLVKYYMNTYSLSKPNSCHRLGPIQMKSDCLTWCKTLLLIINSEIHLNSSQFFSVISFRYNLRSRRYPMFYQLIGNTALFKHCLQRKSIEKKISS